MILISIHVFPAGASAQQFSAETSQFLGANAQAFLKPLIDAMVVDMHSGFAAIPEEEGFHISVRLVGMGTIVPDDQKVFKPKPFGRTVEFTYNGLPFLGDLEINPPELPTAVGLGKRYTFTGRLRRIRPKGSPYTGGFDFIQQDASVTIGGYRDLTLVPMFAPQIDIGSFLGTGLALRFLPSVTIADVGELSALGIGIRHDVGRYFSLPVGISAQLNYQTMKVNAHDREFGVDIDVSGFSAQFCVNKNIPIGLLGVMAYAGAGFESGSTDVRYTFADPYLGAQSVSLSGNNNFRFLAGFSVKMHHVSLNADVNIASMSGFTAGIGVYF